MYMYQLLANVDVKIIISKGLTDVHNFCMGFALCLIILAIIRNYNQFGENMGIKFIASVLISIAQIFLFPKICDNIHGLCTSYARDASIQIKEAMAALCNTDLHPESGWFEKIVLNLMVWFYTGLSYAGSKIRDGVYYIVSGLYYGSIAFTPLFAACLCVPETKNQGVSFLTYCQGFALSPLAFHVADLAMLAFFNDTFDLFLGGVMAEGGAAATAGGVAKLMGAISGEVLKKVGFGILKQLCAFIILYFIACLLVYISTPFLFMKLFRTGSPGSPMGAIAGLAGVLIGKGMGAAQAGAGKIAAAVKGGAGSKASGGGVSAAINAAAQAASAASSSASPSGGEAPKGKAGK